MQKRIFLSIRHGGQIHYTSDCISYTQCMEYPIDGGLSNSRLQWHILMFLNGNWLCNLRISWEWVSNVLKVLVLPKCNNICEMYLFVIHHIIGWKHNTSKFSTHYATIGSFAMVKKYLWLIWISTHHALPPLNIIFEGIW